MTFRRSWLVALVVVMVVAALLSADRGLAQSTGMISFAKVNSECDNGWFTILDSSQPMPASLRDRSERSATLVSRRADYIEGDNLYVFAVDANGVVLGDWSGYTRGPGNYVGGIDYNINTPASPVTFHLYYVALPILDITGGMHSSGGGTFNGSSGSITFHKLGRPVRQPVPPSVLPEPWFYIGAGSVPVDCGGAPVIDYGGAGCDVLMQVPAGSVMGRFLESTRAYWRPGEIISNPPIVLPAGQTAIVIGQDLFQQYYKIVWSCNYLWVPVETMGPAIGDPNWQGAPLPQRDSE